MVLVRSAEQVADEHGRDRAGIPSTATASPRPVVLGHDTGHPTPMTR